MHRVFKFLASIKLAVVVILSLLVLLSVGTFFEARYDAQYAQAVVYQSPWMYAVWALLCINLIHVMIDRWPWRRRHAGFVCAHIGILVLLFGSALTRVKGLDGVMSLAPHKPMAWLSVSEPELIVYSSLGDGQFRPLLKKPVQLLLQHPKKHKQSFQFAGAELKLLDYYHYAHVRETVEAVPQIASRKVATQQDATQQASTQHVAARQAATRQVAARQDSAQRDSTRQAATQKATKQAVVLQGPRLEAVQFQLDGSMGAQSEWLLRPSRTPEAEFNFGPARVRLIRAHYLSENSLRRASLSKASLKGANLSEDGLSGASSTSDDATVDVSSKALHLQTSQSIGEPAAQRSDLPAAQRSDLPAAQRSDLPAAQRPAEIILTSYPEHVRYVIYSKNKLLKQGFLKAGQVIETGWMDWKFRLLKHHHWARIKTEVEPESKPQGNATRAAVLVELVDVQDRLSVVGGDTSPSHSVPDVDVQDRLSVVGGRSEPKPLGDKSNATSLVASKTIKRRENVQQKWLPFESSLRFFTRDKMYVVSFGRQRKVLPFEIELKQFNTTYYPGTDRAASYASRVQVEGQEYEISMNQPLKHKGFTFYQSSFEKDKAGVVQASILSVNQDPGRWIKYLGSSLIVLGTLLLFTRRKSIGRSF